MLRGARQRRADRADAQEPELLAAQRPRRRRIPAAFLLRRVLLEHTPLVHEQVPEHVLGHHPAEHAAGVGEHVIAPERRVEQRLDAGPCGLHPA